MTMRNMLDFSTAAVCFAILLAIVPVGVNAGQEVDIDNDDLGGVVTSANDARSAPTGGRYDLATEGPAKPAGAGIFKSIP